MTLRARVILIVTGLVVVGIAVASVAAYRSTASELQADTDRFLTARADEVAAGLRASPGDRNGGGNGNGGGGDGDDRRPAIDTDSIAQSLDRDGKVVASEGGILPVDERDEAVATGGKSIP